MGKVSNLSIKSSISDKDMLDFEQMVDESLGTSVGRSDYSFIDDSVPVNSHTDENTAESHKDGDVAHGFGEGTLEEKMNDIHNEFLADVTITVANIKDIAFREAAIKGRWCSRLMAERVRKRRLVQTLNSLIEELNGIAASKSVGNGSYLAGRKSIKGAIDSNPEVVALRKEISESNEIEKYLSDLYDCIKGLGYTVKNSLDVLNLERGI